MADEPIVPPAGQPAGQPAGAPQQPPTGDPDGSKPAQDSVSRAELEKVIGERQSAKERARTLEQQLSQVGEQLKAMPDAESLKAFQEWKSQQDEATRQKAIDAGDVSTLERSIREPLVKKVEAQDKTIATLQGQLTGLLRDNDLRAAAAQANAINPSQVVMLLRDRVRMAPDESGQFVPQFFDADGRPLYDGNGRVADARTFVSMFLGLPENANLVRAGAQPGSGAKPAGGAQPSLPTSIAELNALSPEQRAEVTSKMKPEDWARMGLSGDAAKPAGFF